MKKFAVIKLGSILITVGARGEEIVQERSLSGAKGQPTFHDIFLDPFDAAGGSLHLNLVRIGLLTSMVGGGTTNGSGIPVHIMVLSSADYSLGK